MDKTVFGNYILSKPVFRIGFSIIGLFLIFCFITTINDGGYIYVECNNHICSNPLINSNTGLCFYSFDEQYKDPIKKEVCSKAILLEGESLGTKPPWFINNIYLIITVLFFSSFILNHIFYNRRFLWNKQELLLIAKGLKKHFTDSIKRKGNQ